MPVATVRLPDDLNDDIEDMLGYNDTKSDWLRDAAREKLERERSESCEPVPDGGDTE